MKLEPEDIIASPMASKLSKFTENNLSNPNKRPIANICDSKTANTFKQAIFSNEFTNMCMI